MKIIYAASEMVPFASTGGLADVMAALPKALGKRGFDLCRVMPLYRQVAEGGFALKDTGLRLDIPVGFRSYRAEVWMVETPAPKTYFIRRDEFFDRSELYSLPERDYDDNFERFVFFQKAVVALIDALALKPDIVHCCDWQAGLIPLFLKHGVQGMGRNQTERTAFTVHNLAYQGIFPGTMYSLTNLPFFCFTMDILEYFGNINCMKAGIVTSNVVTTVSRTYAQEIMTEEYGCGLQGVMAKLGNRLVGIVNGVDYSTWDPSQDRMLAARYSMEDLAGKKTCKEELMHMLGLKGNLDTPLFGMVTRLADQKGLDILQQAMPVIMDSGANFALLGSGSEKYRKLCEECQSKWPGRFVMQYGFDPSLAHKIEGGADIYMMPSKYEPCGLNQMYSLRYGTIPIVHAVGGLEDTIEDMSADGGTGTGFKFRAYTTDGLLEAVRRALALYRQKDVWPGIVRRAMKQDFSWDRSADSYEMLYQRIMTAPKPS